jgi:hypothetical protein
MMATSHAWLTLKLRLGRRPRPVSRPGVGREAGVPVTVAFLDHVEVDTTDDDRAVAALHLGSPRREITIHGWRTGELSPRRETR